MTFTQLMASTDALRGPRALTARTAARSLRDRIQPRDPSAALTAYTASMETYTRRVERLVEKHVLARLPVLGSGDPLDRAALERGIAELHVELNLLAERVRGTAMSAAKRVSHVARVDVERLLGVTVPLDYRDDLMLGEFAQRNVALMRKLARRQVDHIRKAIDGYTEGDSMRRTILHQLWVARNNSALIARDQVWRFSRESISRWSQAYGSPGAIYHTRKDEHVRVTHAAHEGKFFTWANRPATLDEPNCRCKLIPVQEGL